MKLCDYINTNKKIDTSNWKKIPLPQIFKITGTKTTSKTNLKKIGNGIFPYVTTKSTNNGVDGYYNIWTEEGMVFTVDSAVAGFMSFQENNFSASDHVEKLKPLFNVNKYIADFICCIWNTNKMSKKYSYILKASQKELKRDFIYLPIDQNGNPDWKYMEEFIKMRERDNKNNLERLINKIDKNTLLNVKSKEYRKFKIADLFDVQRGKRIVRNRDYVDEMNSTNIYPVITAKTTNNGVDGYYSKYNCEGNVICSGGEATGMISFYQKDKCWVMDRSRILKPKFLLNKFVALFIVPQLNKFNEYFSYDNSANPDDIKKLSINLPIDQDGNPDWKYMEEFIKMRERDKKDPIIWSKFYLNSFNFYSSKNSLDKNKIIDTKDKIFPYITRTDINNGLHSFISKQNVQINKGNCLTIGLDTQTCFYQDKSFYTGQNIHILRIDGANKYSYLFIATIIKKKIKQLYSWGKNGATLGRLKQESIFLPVKIDGSIDFEYMENYIKSLPYSKYL